MPASTYLKKLKARASESHVHSNHQLVGLEIAKILGDEKHKALYIKLVKDGDAHHLMQMAKSVAEKKDVRRKGAYFMTVFADKNDKPSVKKSS